MGNDWRLLARTILDEEPRRTSFICGLLRAGWSSTAIEGSSYNTETVPSVAFARPHAGRRPGEDAKRVPSRAHRSSAGEATLEGWPEAAIRRAEQTRS